MLRNRAIVTVMGLVALVSACSGPSSSIESSSPAPVTATPVVTDTPTDAPTPDATQPTDSQDPDAFSNMPLGQTITVTGTDGNDRAFGMTVTVGKPLTSRRAQQEYGDPPKHTYLGVRVTYSCTKGLCDYNPFDFTLRGADGTQYDSDYGDGFTPELASGTMHKGAKANGYLTWDVNPGTYTVEYGTSEGIATWVVRFK